jgi:hypothetical protein
LPTFSPPAAASKFADHQPPTKGKTMKNTDNSNTGIITANLTALHARLWKALAEVADAQRAMALNQQNMAIGTILDLERILPECDALYRTIILLHRSRDSFEQNEVHS